MARGYGVIYLGREGCAAPFARRFQELVSNHLDLDFMDKLVLGGTVRRIFKRDSSCIYPTTRTIHQLRLMVLRAENVLGV